MIVASANRVLSMVLKTYLKKVRVPPKSLPLISLGIRIEQQSKVTKINTIKTKDCLKMPIKLSKLTGNK